MQNFKCCDTPRQMETLILELWWKLNSLDQKRFVLL